MGKETLEYIIEKASISDSSDILVLQKRAFTIEAKRYNDYNMPAMTQTIEEIEAEFHQKEFLKAVIDGVIVGSVRAYLDDRNTCHVGRLVVAPEYQKRGLGLALMNSIEKLFITCDLFEIFTGERSRGNIRLYEGLGYHHTEDTEQAGDYKLVFMRKDNRKSKTLDS